MSVFREQQDRSVVVASASTHAAAELIKVTLVAHGFEASVAPSFSPYPSIDFVQGVRVSVLASDEEAVRELMTSLGIPDGRLEK